GIEIGDRVAVSYAAAALTSLGCENERFRKGGLARCAVADERHVAQLGRCIDVQTVSLLSLLNPLLPRFPASKVQMDRPFAPAAQGTQPYSSPIRCGIRCFLLPSARIHGASSVKRQGADGLGQLVAKAQQGR